MPRRETGTLILHSWSSSSIPSRHADLIIQNEETISSRQTNQIAIQDPNEMAVENLTQFSQADE